MSLMSPLQGMITWYKNCHSEEKRMWQPPKQCSFKGKFILYDKGEGRGGGGEDIET